MPDYTICAAFYDADARATMTLTADSLHDACVEAIRRIDDGEVTTSTATWDPSSTFILGVVEGDGSPFDGMHLVPTEFQDPLGRFQEPVQEAPVTLPVRIMNFIQKLSEIRTLEDEFNASTDAGERLRQVHETIEDYQSELGDERLCSAFNEFQQLIAEARTLNAEAK